jgi:hypothetical protein
MSEGNINAEISEHLREHGNHDEHEAPGAHQPSKRRIETIEILEAILLAVVALATALSGYQAARWDGESAREYATSSRQRSEAVEMHLEADQIASYDAATLNAWLQADVAGNEELKTVLEKRFTDAYRAAFEEWVKLDPTTNPEAPPGPRFMPDFKDPVDEEAKALSAEAAQAFDLGVEYRDTGEKYVRVTVILAAVLFLIALGQRFKIRGVRYAVNVVAGVLLVYCLYLFFDLPHLFS